MKPYSRTKVYATATACINEAPAPVSVRTHVDLDRLRRLLRLRRERWDEMNDTARRMLDRALDVTMYDLVECGAEQQVWNIIWLHRAAS